MQSRRHRPRLDGLRHRRLAPARRPRDPRLRRRPRARPSASAPRAAPPARSRRSPPALDAVVVVVLNAAQTEAVLFGADGVPRASPRRRRPRLRHRRPRLRPRAWRRAAAEAGVLYLDAPISGGAAKAAEGQLSVMASGSAGGLRRRPADPRRDGRTVFELGDEPGAGSAMKAVNQLLAGVHIAAMAEALTFGMTQGVAPAQFLEVITKCAGTSWMLENRAPHVVDGDYTPEELGRHLAEGPRHRPRHRPRAPASPPPSPPPPCSSSSPPPARASAGRTTPPWPRSTPATPG